MELGFKRLDETCHPGDRVWWEDLRRKYYGTVIKWKNGYWVDVQEDDGNTSTEFEF